MEAEGHDEEEGVAREDEGFVNVGALQPGTRATRDESSYSEWFRRGR